MLLDANELPLNHSYRSGTVVETVMVVERGKGGGGIPPSTLVRQMHYLEVVI